MKLFGSGRISLLGLINNNIRLAVAMYCLANKTAEKLKAVKTSDEREAIVKDSKLRLDALLSRYIGGDDGVKREATG